MIDARRILIAVGLALVLAAPPGRAQDSAAQRSRPTQPVLSMGQPLRWQPYAAGVGVVTQRGNGPLGGLLVGVYRPVMNPVTGLIGVSAEGYGLAGGTGAVGGRVLATSRAFGLSAGADFVSPEKSVDFVLSFQTAVRRGGLIGRGTALRLDWLPARGQMLTVGVQAPLRQPFAGRTRPRHTTVAVSSGDHTDRGVSRPLPVDAELALATVAEATSLLRAYTNLYSEESENTLLSSIRAYGTAGTATAPGTRRLRYGHAYTAVARAYGEALSQAFGIAALDSAQGERIAARARAGLLDQVILPYNALLGQVKKGGGIPGLTSAAQAQFARWVRDSSRVATSAHAAVESVHARWLGMIERLHGELVDHWNDSRLVWLPLQLALTFEEYDEQAEVDSLIARVLGRPFTDRNALTYLRSSDLPLEIARSIYSARDYHVLWTHDFRGQKETGEVDNIGYSMVADVYLPALTAAVKRYDSTGVVHLPTYMIVLDQHWYEVRNGRLWMTILEDPLYASIRLPGGSANAARVAHLRQRQEELRAAVAASAGLQRAAAVSGGSAWLRRVVKVHVNITQPSDFSFRSHRILPPLPFTPDNIVRDHRKIAFYDLNESDPYRGSVLVMGIGIGEHYASATWEDRGYRLRGPAALEVRGAVRRLLRANGFTEEQIPGPLRAVADSRVAEKRMDLADYVGRAIQLHNEVGFGAKQSSVVRAMLYNLAPPGSAIIVPDPLWLSESWAAMLAGAAARGARVMIIAPALANAPSPEATVMAREHAVLGRLLEIRRDLSAQLKEAGGEIRVGLYTAKSPVDDVEGRRREIREGLARYPWIHQLIPFDAQTIAVLERAETQAASSGQDATDLARDVKARAPKLHQKTQLIARPGAIEALVRQPGWDNVLARSMRVQSEQSARVFEELGRTAPEVVDDAIRSSDVLLRGYELAVSEAERKRVSFYFSLGSQNEDPRGQALDGETTIVVSGFNAATGLVDLYFLMARSSWIERQAELDRLVPPPKSWMKRLAQLVRMAI